ncbi:MAG TPA: Hsp20/alpha crystallin family protein [Candidatus Dormibacteraeota bacterium]|nr:Hsp20/alpha crystallin family protein [Candidatus Dormibacteraeota bacterium]
MAALTRWNPWNELFSLHDQMDQLFNEAFGSTVAPRRNGGGEPAMTLPIDIRQTEEAFVLEASVPGFAPEDVEVTVDQNVLTVQGSRKQESEEARGGWIRRERRTGSFHRQVVLPAEVRAEEITASFQNGVLTVTVPRAQKAQPKRIPVSAGAPAQPNVIDAPQG